MSKSPSQLTAVDRILLHLREHWLASGKVELPASVTQRGIAEATGLQLTHIPRTLKRMREDGMVREVSGHIEGESRRYKAYFLTEEGMRVATGVRGELLGSEVTVAFGGGAPVTMRVADAMQACGCSLLELISSVRDGGNVELSNPCSSREEAPPSDISEAPAPDIFYNREDELRHAESFIGGGRSRVLAVIGGTGMGKTALSREFAGREAATRRVAWLDVRRHPTHHALCSRLLAGLGSDGCATNEPEADGRLAAKALDGSETLLVIDGYYDVPEQAVEFFQAMVGSLKPSERGGKLLVTLREDTPSYNRFYGRREVESGVVEELHLRGLDYEDSRRLLGVDGVDSDAMKRIFLLTKGSPQALKFVASGDVERLRETTRFTNEEIRLLLFLKTVKDADS